MLSAFTLSFGQLFDKRILLLLLKTLGVTLGLLAILGTALYFFLMWVFSFSTWTDGGFLAVLAATLLAIFAAFLLFRVIAMFVINIFSDDVVDAVEEKHYPARAVTAKPPSYALGLKMGLGSAGRALGYNILAAPVYIILAFTGFGLAIGFLSSTRS